MQAEEAPSPTPMIIDSTSEVPRIALDEAKEVADSLGFSLDAKPMVMAEGTIEIERVTKADPAGGDLLVLDLVLVTPALERVWSARAEIEWEEGTLTVVSPEGLIEMKSLRRSGQDLDDIRALEEAE